MSNLKIVIKNFFSLSIGEFLSRLLGIFLFIILARYLGPEKYGIYSVAVSFATIFMLISNFGLDALIMKDIARNKDLVVVYYSSALLLKSSLSILCIIATIFFAKILNYNELTYYGIIIYSLVIIFSSSINTSVALFNAYEKMNFSATINILRSFLSFAIISLLVLFNFDLLMIIFSQPFAYLITFIISVVLLSKNIVHIKFVVNRDILSYFLKTSWPYFFTGLIHIINFKVDILLLSNLTNEEIVGYYSAANDLIVTFLVVPNLFATAFFPNMSKKYSDGLMDTLKKETDFSFRFLTIVGIASGLFFYFLAEPITHLIYGPRYANSSEILKVLSFIITLTFSKVILNWLLTAMDNIKLAMTEYLICLISNIILNFILIPKYGAIGSAYATLASYIIGLLYLFIITQTKLEVRDLIQNYLKTLFVIPFIYFSITFFANYNAVLAVIIACLIYLLHIVVFKLLSLKELKSVLKLV